MDVKTMLKRTETKTYLLKTKPTERTYNCLE